MKMLFISNVFPPGFIGGYELGAFDIANEMSRRGHEIHVLTSDYFIDDQAQITQFTVDRSLNCNALSHDLPMHGRPLKLKGLFDWSNIRRIDATISKFQPDMVVAFNLAGVGVGGIANYLRDCGVPIVFYIMDNIFGEIEPDSRESLEFKRVFGSFSVGDKGKIVAMSRNVMRQVEPFLTASSKDKCFIPGWIDETKVPAEVRESAGPTARFVFCSRVAPHKGINIVLDACAALRAAGETRFLVDVYGSGEVVNFKQRVKALDLEDLVSYRGSLPKDQMLDAFGDYDALLFPTWEREPYGFVVSEAAAAGCIPIMTDGIGASEWFIDGEDSLKIKRSTPSLILAMREIIGASPQERTKRRQTAMTSAKRNLSAQRWMAVFEQLCGALLADSEIDRAVPPRSIAASYLGLYELWKDAL